MTTMPRKIKRSFTYRPWSVSSMWVRAKARRILPTSLPSNSRGVVIRLPDHLKRIPGRAALSQFERVDGHAEPEQPGAKLELVLGISLLVRLTRPSA